MPSDWGYSYWSSTSTAWPYYSTTVLIYEDELEDEEPKEKHLGFDKYLK